MMPMHFTLAAILVFLSAEESINFYIPVLETVLVNKKLSAPVPIKYNIFLVGGRKEEEISNP